MQYSGFMNPMDYPKIFGSDFGKRNNQPVLTIGDRHYTRYDMGQIGCPHPHAVRTLNLVLKQLGVRDLEHLVREFSPEDFVGLAGFGVTSFYALICVLRHAKVRVQDFYTAKTTVLSLQHKVRQREEDAARNSSNQHKRRA